MFKILNTKKELYELIIQNLENKNKKKIKS